MFKEGDFIIYGSNGVCQVEHIGSMELQGVPDDKMYYTLVPVYGKKEPFVYTGGQPQSSHASRDQ